MFVLVLTQFSFASQQDEYLLKAQIVKNQVNPDMVYNTKVVAKGESVSNAMRLEKMTLSDYYIVKTSIIEKYGVKFEELTYKNKNNGLGIFKSSGPENGDFKAINTITGLTISNPVKGILVGEAISYLQQDLKGSGNVFTKKRTVSKWGQIYKNGSWVDYYYGSQVELKWGYDYYIYNKKPNGTGDGSVLKIYNVRFDNESNNPIYVKFSHSIRDNNAVFNLANAQYKSNQYIYRDYLGPSDYLYSQDWRIGVNPAY